MTKTQVEVITSVQRRRRWSLAEKERIVAAAIEPGANASDVARAAGIHVSQLFRWRKELCSRPRAAPLFSAVAVVPDGRAAANSAASIEIEFATGTRVRITGSADPSTVRIAIAALAKIERRR
jgi:transposase